MPRTRKDEAPILLDEPEIEGRYVELGDWTVSYETYRAGDACYVAPGHLPLVLGSASVVEFSPTDQLQATMAVLGARMAAAEEPVR
jgi:hypothetical protein